jgi:protein-disulfide isomerase
MVAAFVVIVVAVGIGFQAWRTSRSPSATPSTSTSASPVTITNERPIPLGSPDAPVTITLYEDFHCPHCADFEEEFGSTITQAQQSGQVRVELYPMSFIDEGSVTAANAMACAAEAGFGQAYYLGLFANHNLQWSDPQLIDLASKVGGHPRRRSRLA